MSKAPIVAIVGRANVGKSSLFNAILGRREAIVAREPGTTRDSISTKVSVNNKDFWLVDTAGMKNPEDEFELSIQAQISEALASADIILMVVDAPTQVVEEDRRVAKLALRSNKPILLAINKIDKNKGSTVDQWRRLGIKQMVSTSATQKQGIDELLEVFSKQLPSAKISEAKNRIRLAVLGRPNVGKSSLFNALGAKQQAIVSARAGTTRDVNRLNIKYHGREIELIDTAGIRRPGKIETGVEQFSVLRTIKAIEESDIALVLMDVSELNVALDQKIAGMVKEAGRGLILVISKWDVLEDKTQRDHIAAQVASHFEFVPWAPLVFTSANSGQNLTKLFELALDIDANRKSRFKTPELNRWLTSVTHEHPPASVRGQLVKLRYMVQENDIDLPSFKIFGANVKLVHFSYKRYLEKQFREVWPLEGTPIKFWFINKSHPNT